MEIVYLPSTDPRVNAAEEERLFRQRPFPVEPRLLFYTNNCCVQCGRNQRPEWECALDWCQSQGIPVLKRFSGGGTVWHDLGNLNYSFIMPRRHYDPSAVLSLVANALVEAGVPSPRICPRFSIWHGDYKISGSAFALSGPAALLHGCLPFQADLSLLKQALQPQEKPTATPAGGYVHSVVSPVCNICSISSHPLDCRERFIQALTALATAWAEALPRD